MRGNKDNFIFRVRVVYVIFLLFGAVLIVNLFFIQVVRGNYYSERASRQYIAPSGGYFDRGSIYFKQKDGQIVSAATVKKGYVLAINPEKLKNPETAYEKISNAFGHSVSKLDKGDFLRRAAKKNDPYEEIVHKLNEEQANAIKKLKIAGVDVYSESWRFYPAGNLASRVLGFVGYKGNKLAGRYGIESYYEKVLSRENEKKKNINSFAEIFMGIKGIISGDSQEGDIVTTIEPSAQLFLENALERTHKKYKSNMAGGIIIEPSTGKIVAMSVKPNFNPNNYGETSDFSLFLNPMVQNIYEMGSIMKPLTLSAALDQGAITPQTDYFDKGYRVFRGGRIENYDGRRRGRVDMQQVLDQSLNTGAVFAMQQLGKEKFKEYMLKYGFGEKTGIDLPDETKGMISNLNSGRDIEYATASFGQGIALTPIEMVAALSSIANGGKLMRPYIIDEIKTEEGIGKKIKPREIRRVLKKETAEEMNRMLVNVADDALMGGTVKLKHYTFAAKTGTAQIHKESGGGYYKNQYLHTFFGYFPGFNAKFLVFLFLVKPQGVPYASHSLTKPFMNIMKFMINYYDIQPDR